MITCDQHDYIEIVCTFHYPIKLIMCNGDVVECTALDTQLNEERLECIKVDRDAVQQLIVLDQIAVLEVSVENPHFKSVTFK